MLFFFFNDTATTEIYTYLHTLSLPTLFRPQHDLLWNTRRRRTGPCMARRGAASEQGKRPRRPDRLRRKGCQPWPHGLAKARDHRHQRRRAAGTAGRAKEIGRAHVGPPVTNAHLVCRLLLEKKKTQ